MNDKQIGEYACSWDTYEWMFGQFQVKQRPCNSLICSLSRRENMSGYQDIQVCDVQDIQICEVCDKIFLSSKSLAEHTKREHAPPKEKSGGGERKENAAKVKKKPKIGPASRTGIISPATPDTWKRGSARLSLRPPVESTVSWPSAGTRNRYMACRKCPGCLKPGCESCVFLGLTLPAVTLVPPQPTLQVPQHQQQMNSDPQVPVKEKCHICVDCGKTFSRKDHLTNHSNIHSEITFPCKKCNSRFSRKDKLSTHMMKAHRPVNQIVNVKKCHTCVDCGKTFSRKDHLTNHSNIHSKITFPCKKCNSMFSRKDKLSTHMMKVHRPVNQIVKVKREKCHTCVDCGKTFSRKDHLTIHSNIHSGISFQCEICNRWFSRKDKLGTHMTKVHHPVNQIVNSYLSS